MAGRPGRVRSENRFPLRRSPRPMSWPPKYDGALRDIQSPTGLHYRIHETPEDLVVLTPRVAQEPAIWIDTETADWNTKSPRLSLVHGATPEMAAAYHSTFAPRVIAA